VDLLVAWVALPLLLAALCLGCGLLVERAAGAALPGAALLPLGLCAIVVAGGLATAIGAIAVVATPLVVALAVAGLVWGRPLAALRPDPWTIAAAVAVFAVFAAPIVASGSATFAGYIRLDDTATWLAFTDRIMDHGRDLSGLPPSTYEATLAFNLSNGYPIGAFIPLGVGQKLVGLDPAWAFQPYLAFLGALLALGLTPLARAVVRSSRAAALVAFLAAQPALLFGYYLWGGIKEMSTAAVLPLVALLLPGAAVADGRVRPLLPLAVAIAAVVGMLSFGGAIWLVPLLAAGAVLAASARGVGRAGRTSAVLAVEVAVLAIPAIATGEALPPTSSPLTSPAALGNLFHPLDVFQVAGIWPVGDFRVSPTGAAGVIAAVLIALLIAAAAIGVWRAWRVGAAPLLLFGLGGLVAGLVIALIGSPWVEAKALAIASVCLPALAATGALALWRLGRRGLGALLLAAIAAGILWSNALGYHDANLAPRSQLAELETIGQRIAGEGPTLMTEYQPYGVRHFLRDAAPEGASELRRHLDPLLSGRGLPKGTYADTDRFELGPLMRYRTLVLRRSPAQSRPPSPYRLTWRGHYYEVWQRPPGTRGAVLDRLGLGTGVDPGGVPTCPAVLRLARRVPPGGSLAAVPRRPVEAFALGSLSHPRSWTVPGSRTTLVPDGAGTIRARVRVARPGVYGVWLEGGVRPQVDLLIDGRPVNSVRGELENLGQYVELGAVPLGPGVHRVEIRFHGSDLVPGSGGRAQPIGPLVVSSQDTADTKVVRLPRSRARALCGRRLDWIEALRPTAASR
jgi:hypothetical protein